MYDVVLVSSDFNRFVLPVSSSISNGRKDGAGRESASGGRRGEGEKWRGGEVEREIKKIYGVFSW